MTFSCRVPRYFKFYRVTLLALVFYILIIRHFVKLISEKRNATYYPQFSKEKDSYAIDPDSLLSENQSLSRCSSHQMLIGVISQPSEVLRRQAVRNSWAKDGYRYSRTFTKVVFFIGKTNKETIQRETIKEAEMYNDVIITDIVENYYNLSLKTFAILDFAYKYCPFVRCIIKTDSDNVLNIAGFENLCRAEKDIKSIGYIGGLCNVRRTIRREYRHKWYVPYFVYPQTYYPQYCSTGAYGYFHRNAWLNVYHAVFKSSYFSSSNMRHLPEDVLFTGVFANHASVPRVNLRGFSFVATPQITCYQRRSTFFSVHLHQLHTFENETEAIILQSSNIFSSQNQVCNDELF